MRNSKNEMDLAAIVHSHLDEILKKNALEIDGIKIKKIENEYGWVVTATYGNMEYTLKGW